jgi:hypothetical protein
MAWLSAYLPAGTASGIWDRTTTTARAMQGPDEDRTLTQLRADTLAAWLLEGTTTGTGDTTTITGTGGTMPGISTAGSTIAGTNAGGTSTGATTAGGVPSPKAQVLVTVPVFALMGLTDEPATLDGYGPIPASMARTLVADGADSFHRVLTDPRDGAPLEIGRTSYRIPTAMRQWLRLRDGKCPFPGCNNHSLDNEADHLLAWTHGGTTGITNLGQPCRKHHKLRHTTAWKPTQATKNEPRLDLTHRTPLPKRTTKLGTTPLAQQHRARNPQRRDTAIPKPVPKTVDIPGVTPAHTAPARLSCPPGWEPCQASKCTGVDPPESRV